MRAMLTLFVYLALCLTALVSANKGKKECWTCPRDEHHGVALIETWVGRGAINVGDIHTVDLYHGIRRALEAACGPDTKHCWKVDIGQIDIRYANPGDRNNFLPTVGGNTKLVFDVSGSYETDEIRIHMIRRASRAIGRLIEEKPGTIVNCYVVSNSNKFCNIGDFLYINLPNASNGNRNYLRIDFKPNADPVGTFKCCRSHDNLNFEWLGHEIGRLFNKPFTQEARCLIWGYKTCEECGSECDRCGKTCEGGCTNGKC